METVESLKKFPPKWRLVLLDETDNWDDAQLVKECDGRIFGLYLMDNNRKTHCCEVTPSFELHFLRNEPGWEVVPDDDELCERVRDILEESGDGGCPVMYVHTYQIKEEDMLNPFALGTDSLEEIESALEEAGGDPVEAYNLLLEAAQEALKATDPCPPIPKRENREAI